MATPDSADGIPVASESGVPENAAVPGTGMNPAGIYQEGQNQPGQPGGGLLGVQRPPETPEHRQQAAVHQAELREGDMSNARPDPLEK